MANWWEEVPLAEQPRATAEPTPSGDWWESAPVAEPAVPALPQRTPTASQIQADAMRQSYANPPQVQEPLPVPAGTSAIEQQAAAMRPVFEAEALKDPGVQAQLRGIMLEGADAELRAAYQKLPPNQRNQYAEFMVNRYFQKQSGGNGEYVPVRYDEGVQTHIFRDPADGKWKPLNDIGMDMEDAKEFMKYVVAPAGASLAAGGLGMLSGSPAIAGLAALSADAATAGAMRASDVEDLIVAGLLPPSVSPGLEGSKEAAWAVGGAALGGMAGRALRKGIGGVDDIPMEVDVDRSMVNDMLQRYNKEYGDQMPNLTLDEKMSLVAKTPSERAAAERVRSRKETLRNSSEARKVMLERQQENEEAFRQGLDSFLQVAGRQDSPGVFRSSGISADEILASSSRIIDTLETDARQKLKQYDQSLAQAYQNASTTFDNLLSDAANPREMPETFSSAIRASRDAFQKDMDVRYDEIADAVGGERRFDVAPLKQELRSIRSALLSEGKFNQLMDGIQGLEPKQVIRAGGSAAPDPDDELLEVFFGDAFRKQSGILVPDSIRRQRAEAAENYSYRDIDSAVKAIRRRMRKLPDDTDPSVWATFGRVEKALEDIRDAGLRQIDPELASSQQALDATYKLGMDVLDRGLLKKLKNQVLQPRPGEPGVLKPSTFDKLFKGDSGTETVRDLRTLVNKDVFDTGVGAPISSLGVQDTVRKGLLGALREQARVTRGPGGEAPTVSPEAFAKFKRDYRDALGYALKPGQLDRIENMTSLKRALESAEADYKAAKDAILSFPWGSREIANDPSQLFRNTWGPAADDPTKYKRSQELRAKIREAGDPEGLLTDYRKMIANDMMRQTQGAKGYVDPELLREYLDKHQELLQTWYTSNGKSGTDLVENLKTYSDIGRSIMQTAGLAHADKDRLLSVLNSVSRAYVGVFTTPGRILTAFKQLAGGASTSREADFILNPQKYVRNQDYYEILDSQSFRALQRAGGHAMIQMLREDMGQPEAEQDVQPLFGQ